MTEIKEIKKKGRPSRENNILTKNAFEKKEDAPVVPIEEKKAELPPTPPAPIAPNTPVQTAIVPIDMPKPKKERSAAQIETTKKMLEANKLKKANKTIIIIKEDTKEDDFPKESLTKAKREPKEDDFPKESLTKAKREPKKESKVDDFPKESLTKAKRDPKKEKKEPVKKEKKVKKVKYVSSSEESESESSSEEKYIKKAIRKLELVNSIDARLKQNAIPRTKYSNLSIFS